MRRRTAAALLLAYGALALGALANSASAGGRNDTFTGPIEQAPPPEPGFRTQTQIELMVHTQHHHDGSRAAYVVLIVIVDVNARCENGAWVGAGLPAGGKDTIIFNSHSRMDIKHGSFAEPRGYGAEGESVAIKGTVQGGVASGTLSVSLDEGTQPAEIEGEPPQRLGTCRSGTLHWSASRRG